MKKKPEEVKAGALVKKTEALMLAYPEGEYNRLLPTTTLIDNIGNFQAPKIEVLQFDPNEGGGDVYVDKRLGENKRLFTKTALDKIAYAGGLSWYAPLCVVEERIPGVYIRFKATAVVKKASGEPYPITRTKEIDLELEAEKLRDDYRRWGIWKYDQQERKRVQTTNFSDEELEATVRRDILQLRGNMLQLCETKACNRVIRAAFGLKSSYTADEVKKPFVLVRFDIALDPNDPAVRAALASRMQGAVGGLFGAPAPPIAAQLEAPLAAAVTTADDLGDLLDDEPEPAIDEVMTPEQDAALKREARTIELADGLDLDGLKDQFTKLFKGCGYSREEDPRGYIGRWVLGNSKPEEERRRHRAELIVDLENEAGDEGSKQ